MKAFAYSNAHKLSDFAITLQQVAEPELKPTDILVNIKAFSFNPVDYKIRQSRNGSPVILGWDAAGVVEAVGKEVKGFKTGDEVYYSGDLMRNGSYAEKQAVDYRIVAHKPKSLSFEDAAALPLTTLTAYEALLERGIEYNKDSKVLIIGGAGGVGSISIQLIKALTPAKVIATATRPDTIEWVKKMGADVVIGRALEKELKGEVDVVFGTTHTKDYLQILPKIMKPFGHLTVIDDPETLDIRPFKTKALSVHWEFMFSKSMHGFKMETQGEILKTLAKLVDGGKVKTTRTKIFPASVENLRLAHETLEKSTAFGKMVMQGLN